VLYSTEDRLTSWLARARHDSQLASPFGQILTAFTNIKVLFATQFSLNYVSFTLIVMAHVLD